MKATPDRIRPAPILHVGRFARVTHRKISVAHHVDGHKGHRAVVWWAMRYGWSRIVLGEEWYA